MILYVGLGNPGPTYEKNRHNIGFRIIDALMHRTGASAQTLKTFNCNLYKNKKRLFLKPLTYMNNSGKSVMEIASFYKIPIQNIIVIHDDIDLPFGSIRFKIGGGSGGHNGLKSIDSILGNGYIRIRVGVGRPECKDEVVRYVLSNFTKEEESFLSDIIDKTVEAALAIPDMPIEVVKSKYTFNLMR